jgi:hypothetical protein
MKKNVLLIIMVVITLFSCSCKCHEVFSKNEQENVSSNSQSESTVVDLNLILEVDDGQYDIGININHGTVISDDPQTFVDENAPMERTLALGALELNLKYKGSLYYPVGSRNVYQYLVDGDESKKVMLDGQGNIHAIQYRYVQLDIKRTAAPEEVFASLQKELQKIVNLSYYKNVEMPEGTDDSDSFGSYTYLLYNDVGGYITDYLRVSVLETGEVTGLWVCNLKEIGAKVTINKEKEHSAIDLKMKEMFDTDNTLYQSYSMSMELDPYFVEYENQLYVRYFVSANYLHAQRGEEKSSLISIMIPLHFICN